MSADPAVTFQLELPYPRPPKALVGNSRAHWRQRSADTAQVRTTVLLLAKQAGIPVSTHLTVELVWAPGDRRRRDADNLWPMLKVCCDALARGPRRDWIGLELVPDDTPEHMTKLTPRIEAPPARGMWLTVTAHGPTAPAVPPRSVVAPRSWRGGSAGTPETAEVNSEPKTGERRHHLDALVRDAMQHRLYESTADPKETR